MSRWIPSTHHLLILIMIYPGHYTGGALLSTGDVPARRSGQVWRRGCAAAAAAVFATAGLLALAPASHSSLSSFLLQDDTSVGRVPKSWGGYENGLWH